MLLKYNTIIYTYIIIVISNNDKTSMSGVSFHLWGKESSKTFKKLAMLLFYTHKKEFT